MGESDWLAAPFEITRDEVKRVVALGTPAALAARVAWLLLRAVLAAHSMPAFAKAVADAERGNVKAVVADFEVSSRYDAEQVKLQKTIGRKVCGSG